MTINREMEAEEGFAWRVLLVEDEEFTRGLLTQTLTRAGVKVHSCASAAEALRSLDAFEPHVVMTDLDLGVGPSGVHLINRIATDAPWVGRIILSAHASPELGARDGAFLSDDVVYLVKSEVTEPGDLFNAIKAAIERQGSDVIADPSGQSDDTRIVISAAHGEILRLVAEGLSNAGIAAERETSVRAAEGMVQRMFLALGIRPNPRHNARVLAVRMWQQGRVAVR